MTDNQLSLLVDSSPVPQTAIAGAPLGPGERVASLGKRRTSPRRMTKDQLKAELGALKRASPHSYKDLKDLTDRSRSTLHDWITCKHLPVARDNDDFRALAELLGSSNPDDLLDSVIALRNPSNTSSADPSSTLTSFPGQASACLFSGEALIEQLVQRSIDSIAAQSRTPLIVIGAARSGKTSLLQAGLLGNLEQRHGFDTRYITPSDGEFLPPTCQPDTVVRVVVVDQFEDHFVQDNASDFTRLMAAMSNFCEEPNTLLVIGVRSDFFRRVTEIPLLLAALQDSPIVVGARNP